MRTSSYKKRVLYRLGFLNFDAEHSSPFTNGLFGTVNFIAFDGRLRARGGGAGYEDVLAAAVPGHEQEGVGVLLDLPELAPLGPHHGPGPPPMWRSLN